MQLNEAQGDEANLGGSEVGSERAAKPPPEQAASVEPTRSQLKMGSGFFQGPCEEGHGVNGKACATVATRSIAFPRQPKAKWCDLGESSDEAEVDLGQLRAALESAIGYELLGFELHECSDGDGTELLLQLPEHGTWSLAVAQAVRAAAGQAGVRGPVHAFGEQWQ